MKLSAFKRLVKEYMSIDNEVDGLNKALRKLDPEFNFIGFSKYKMLFLDTIREATNDKNDWLGYFIFEMDCKFSKKSVGKHKDGKPIFIRNYEDLYKLITLNNEI